MDLDKLTTEQINGFSAAEAGFHVSQVLREALAEKASCDFIRMKNKAGKTPGFYFIQKFSKQILGSDTIHAAKSVTPRVTQNTPK